MAAKCQILIYCNLFVIALFQQVCYYYIKENSDIGKKRYHYEDKKCADLCVIGGHDLLKSFSVSNTIVFFIAKDFLKNHSSPM